MPGVDFEWFVDEDLAEAYRALAVAHNVTATRYDRPLLPGDLETLVYAENAEELLEHLEVAASDLRVLADFADVIRKTRAEVLDVIRDALKKGDS